MASSGAGKDEAPEPNIAERMEGLQGRMAEIERKHGRITYFGGAACLLAVLASGAALYLAIATPNSASESDFDELTTKVDQLADEVSAASRSRKQVKSLKASVDSLITRVDAVEKQSAKNASDIAAAKAAAQRAAAATPTPTTPTTPAKPAKPGGAGSKP